MLSVKDDRSKRRAKSNLTNLQKYLASKLTNISLYVRHAKSLLLISIISSDRFMTGAL